MAINSLIVGGNVATKQRLVLQLQKVSELFYEIKT
jgi:hypothetical protein